jgi:phage terminase large subunit
MQNYLLVDFGFSNDPSALISVYRYNGEIIIDEVIYQKVLLNSQLASMINSSGARNGISMLIVLNQKQ